MKHKLLQKRLKFVCRKKLKISRTGAQRKTKVALWAQKKVSKDLGRGCDHRGWKFLYSMDKLMFLQFDDTLERPLTALGSRLKELRQLQLIYGSLPRSLNKVNTGLYSRSSSSITVGPTPSLGMLAFLLETRLDRVVQSTFALKRITQAQHSISRGWVSVNERVIKSCNYQCKNGDLLSFDERIKIDKESLQRKKKFIAVVGMENGVHKKLQEWCTLRATLSTTFFLTGLPAGWQPASPADSRRRWERATRSTLKLQTFKEWLWKTTQDPSKMGNRVTTAAFVLEKRKSFCYNHGRQDFINIQNPGVGNPPLADQPLTLFSRFFYTMKNEMGKKRIYLGEKKRRKVFFSLLSLFVQPALQTDGLLPLRVKNEWHQLHKSGLNSETVPCRGYKPLHLEVSYRLRKGIFLYSPQKILWPSMISGGKSWVV